jgi:hypothetical protein
MFRDALKHAPDAALPTVHGIMTETACIFEDDNPLFNRHRFFEACKA